MGDDYPRKPIRVVVPFQPGGGSDTLSESYRKAINDNELMPQPLVVVNKPGEGPRLAAVMSRTLTGWLYGIVSPRSLDGGEIQWPISQWAGRL